MADSPLQVRARCGALLLLASLAGCGSGRDARITVGFSMDSLQDERWRWDRDLVSARCEERGARILVTVAEGNDELQKLQAADLLRRGVDVLMVEPHDRQAAASIVDAAHRAGVPVVAYDRLIANADVDLYVSFDNEQVGELQAEYLLSRRPRGKYVLIGGAPTDNNAHMFREGQLEVLKPAVQRGDVTIVMDRPANEWLETEAYAIAREALEREGGKIDAIVASNDTLAGGAIKALTEAGLAGKVAVSGQDADLAACQRIAAGTQSMTVYKPIWLLAKRAADAALLLARKQPLGEKTRPVHNGRKDVPSILLKSTAVDRDNLESTVVRDGYHELEEVFGAAAAK